MSEEIENIIEEILSPDSYCLVHNYIVFLQQKLEQLEKENKKLKQPQVFIDCEDIEERYARDLYLDYLIEKINQLENIIKEAIEYVNDNKNKTIAPYGDNEDTDYEICLFEDDIENLLNILNKGSE